MPAPLDSEDQGPELDGELVSLGDGEGPLPVLAEARPLELERPRPVTVPAAVVAATGGFLLGIATFVIVRVLRRPKPARLTRAQARRRRRRGREPTALDIASTRSFLVDVHLLRDR